MAVLRILLQDIVQVGKARAQAHHMPFAQGIDRRVRDLTEILAEEVTDGARLVGNDGERRVITH